MNEQLLHGIVGFQMQAWEPVAATRVCVGCGDTFDANSGLQRNGLRGAIYACSEACAVAHETRVATGAGASSC